MKRSAPAALRNRGPIASVLRDELAPAGLVLEVASGSGEHVVWFAREFPQITWQPSESDPAALASIAAWREDTLAQGAGANLRPPMRLDVAGADWPSEPIMAMLAINLLHISPPEVTEALLHAAARLLPQGAPLVLYGPFSEEGQATAPSNRAFDESLRTRDPRWGLRSVEWLDALATTLGLSRTRRVEMPANNLTLVYRRYG